MIKYELADCNVISEIKNFGATSLPGPEGFSIYIDTQSSLST